MLRAEPEHQRVQLVGADQEPCVEQRDIFSPCSVVFLPILIAFNTPVTTFVCGVRLPLVSGNAVSGRSSRITTWSSRTSTEPPCGSRRVTAFFGKVIFVIARLRAFRGTHHRAACSSASCQRARYRSPSAGTTSSCYRRPDRDATCGEYQQRCAGEVHQHDVVHQLAVDFATEVGRDRRKPYRLPGRFGSRPERDRVLDVNHAGDRSLTRRILPPGWSALCFQPLFSHSPHPTNTGLPGGPRN